MMMYVSIDAGADRLESWRGFSYDDDRLGSGAVVLRRGRLSFAQLQPCCHRSSHFVLLQVQAPTLGRRYGIRC